MELDELLKRVMDDVATVSASAKQDLDMRLGLQDALILKISNTVDVCAINMRGVTDTVSGFTATVGGVVNGLSDTHKSNGQRIDNLTSMISELSTQFAAFRREQSAVTTAAAFRRDQSAVTTSAFAVELDNDIASTVSSNVATSMECRGQSLTRAKSVSNDTTLPVC